MGLSIKYKTKKYYRKLTNLQEEKGIQKKMIIHK